MSPHLRNLEVLSGVYGSGSLRMARNLQERWYLLPLVQGKTRTR